MKKVKLEDALELLADNLDAFNLKGAEITPEDAQTLINLMKDGMEEEDAIDKVLTDIREVLDDGLIHRYEFSISYFISDQLADAETCAMDIEDQLNDCDEVKNVDCYNDGEDWCVDAIIVLEFDVPMKKESLFNELSIFLNDCIDLDCTWDYHYIKGLDDNFYWCP